MAIKVGDNVKFLNATGGGVVRKIIDSRLVSVAIEGGFEIPVMASELLVIEPVDAGSKFFHQSFDVPENEAVSTQTENSSEGGPEALSNVAIRSRRSDDILLVFVPHDQKWLITGHLDVFLVNNTSYDVIYNHFRKDDEKNWVGVNYGSLESGTRLLLATIHRDELPLWADGCLQFLFHKELCEEIPLPYHAEFSIAGKKFYTEQSYQESIYVEGKCIVARIAALAITIEEKKDNKISVDPPQKTYVNVDDFIQRHKTAEREAEVDLHIDELVDDSTSFEKVEILEYQKNYFNRCLESAIVNGYLKVIFIHGVGNGVLKEVLMDILKKQEGIEVFDAPMQKYGVGAIEVHIRHNR